jgi:hypothetical protein
MKLNVQDLKGIATLTLEHYNQRAEEFWTGTRDHDISQNIAAMLQYIECGPPWSTTDQFVAGAGDPSNSGFFDLADAVDLSSNPLASLLTKSAIGRSIPKELLEPLRRQRSLARRILNIAMA